MSSTSFVPTASSRPATLTLAGVLVAGLLILDPGGWHVFGPVKWLVLTAGTWLALALALRDGLPLHRGSLMAWGLVLVWGAFTSLVALDPLSAWLGTPDRRMGMVGLSTIAAAFLAGQAITDQSGRRLLARAGILSLLGMGVYGAAEAIGWAAVDLSTTTSRLGSTLGSPAYLGAALCLLLPIAAGAGLDRREAPRWRIASGLAVGGAVFLLIGSGTRAALVGVAVAALFTVSLWWPEIRRRPLPIVAAVVVLGAMFLVLPDAGRLVRPEVEGRLAEWRTAMSALGSSSVTGAGLEGYRVAFPAHVDVDYVRAYGRTTVTDRAHSGPLDMGVAVGVPGLVAWVVAAGWLVWRAGRSIRPGDPVLAGLAAGVVGLLVQELFLFPTLEVGVAGWVVAGAVVAARPSPRSIEIRSAALAGSAATLAIVAVIVGGADVVADHVAASARSGAEVAEADRAAAIRFDSFRYPLLGAHLALAAGRPEEALTRIEDALDMVPADPALRLARARVVASLVSEGAWSPARGADEIGEILQDDPNHPELRLLHGRLLAAAGDAARAERAWLAASHLSPRDAEAELRLAALYSSLGEPELARRALDRAVEREPDHPDIARVEEELDDP